MISKHNLLIVVSIVVILGIGFAFHDAPIDSLTGKFYANVEDSGGNQEIYQGSPEGTSETRTDDTGERYESTYDSNSETLEMMQEDRERYMEEYQKMMDDRRKMDEQLQAEDRARRMQESQESEQRAREDAEKEGFFRKMMFWKGDGSEEGMEFGPDMGNFDDMKEAQEEMMEMQKRMQKEMMESQEKMIDLIENLITQLERLNDNLEKRDSLE